MNRDVLLALADRCERGEPIYELDKAIAIALDWVQWGEPYGGLWYDPRGWTNVTLPRWTESLDAAATLVPDGRGYVLRCHGDGAASAIIPDPPRDVVLGKTRSIPALALCAAALRARAGLLR